MIWKHWSFCLEVFLRCHVTRSILLQSLELLAIQWLRLSFVVQLIPQLHGYPSISLPVLILDSPRPIHLLLKHNHLHVLQHCHWLLRSPITWLFWKRPSNIVIWSVNWRERRTKTRLGKPTTRLSLVECRSWNKEPFVCGSSVSIDFLIHFCAARPNADGRLFLEQLVDSLKTSETDDDGRTHADFASDLGFPITTLASLSHPDQQRAALRVFNAAYPTSEDKDVLINVGYLVALRPQFLPDLLGESSIYLF